MTMCSTGYVLHIVMANLTLAVDHDLLHRARVRAAEEGTSVNAVVRDLLSAYSAADRVDAARRRLVALSISSAAGSGGRPLTGGGAA